MKKYRIKLEYHLYFAMYIVKGTMPRFVTHHVQVKSGILGWITVKSFTDEDNEYAYRCARELLDKLKESI